MVALLHAPGRPLVLRVRATSGTPFSSSNDSGAICAASRASSSALGGGLSAKQQPAQGIGAFNRPPRIIIAGGSIAGLALYAALAKYGLVADNNVDVIEEKAANSLGGGLGGRSTGISLGPSALRALRTISRDLADEVIDESAELKTQVILSPAGEVLQRVDSRCRERYGEPAVMIRWSRLHKILRSHVPAGKLHFERRFESFRPGAGESMEVNFRGPNGNELWPADILVGCDGVRSAVRTHLLGEDAPRDVGRVGFRCVVPTASLSGDWSWAKESGIVTFAEGRSGTIMDTGLGTTYCAFGVLDELAATASALPTAKERCLALLASSPASEGGWPRHAEVFAAAADADIREDRVLDRPSLDPEALAAAAAGAAGGGVTLVGDALHPMIPSTGFGAASAIEGALELAQCLSAAVWGGADAGGGGYGSGATTVVSADAVQEALRRYERARLLGRARAVQLQSFEDGRKSYMKAATPTLLKKGGSSSEKRGEEDGSSPPSFVLSTDQKGARQHKSNGNGTGVDAVASAAGGGEETTSSAGGVKKAAAAAEQQGAAGGEGDSSSASRGADRFLFTDWLHSYVSPWEDSAVIGPPHSNGTVQKEEEEAGRNGGGSSAGDDEQCRRVMGAG